MTDPDLQIYLPAIMLVACWLTIFWRHFRKITQIAKDIYDVDNILEYNRLKRVSGYFWVIFSVFSFMTIIYSLFPDLYYLFIPLDVFHHPIINSIGLLILKVAIIWILVAQITIDKELYKYSKDIESLSAMELVRYSEQTLLAGMLVFFIGFFTTITNFIGFLLVILGIYIYHKMFYIN
ncbi:hypothetical protein [Chondrinema litorale]|uniref:hypothetical protein n=1 Tax=Chondrinema litorale TaxID=2994555 RepID=UPI0025432606|nr:hypothetical protein [Chondrinema litorale]UZR98939.1 hypothetical protein OQ292_34380 [Chondrinema litorale]